MVKRDIFLERLARTKESKRKRDGHEAGKTQKPKQRRGFIRQTHNQFRNKHRALAATHRCHTRKRSTVSTFRRGNVEIQGTILVALTSNTVNPYWKRQHSGFRV